MTVMDNLFTYINHTFFFCIVSLTEPIISLTGGVQLAQQFVAQTPLCLSAERAASGSISWSKPTPVMHVPIPVHPTDPLCVGRILEGAVPCGILFIVSNTQQWHSRYGDFPAGLPVTGPSTDAV